MSVLSKLTTFELREDSQLGLILGRFKRNKLAMVGLVITSFYLVLAAIGPHIAPYDPAAMDTVGRLAAPSLDHPFGTDRYGRDVLSRVIMGARVSLKVAVIVVGFASVVGTSLGLIAGYLRGWFDEAIMRLVDVLFAFPSILLALVVIAVLGPGLNKAIIALAIAYTPVMIRIVRGSALSVREEEFVLAAISYGESDINIMIRDMLPNIASSVIVQSTITFAFAILAEAGLSYLGLSAQPPTPTWGVIISQGQNVIMAAPWVSFFTGLTLSVTVLGLTFLGIGLRDALDPKTDTSESAREGGI